MVPDPILERLSRLHPKVMDLSLGRLSTLLGELGHPERALPPVIHVAGTNGKGSTIATLRAIHTAAGRTVHVYTSPHLVRFAERIVLAGEEIGNAALSAILEECERVNAGRQITFFEITTAAGLLAFSRTPADLLLLEVGLGGRFDATNVIDRPALSVITPVSLDHQHYLGDTIAEIAFEKAGILKPGVPAVIARQPEDALEVILARAEEIGAPAAVCGRDWSVDADGDGLVFRTESMTRRLPRSALAGAHQIDNAGTALAAVEVLQGRFPVSGDALAGGLTATRWPARLQRLSRGPMIDALPSGTELWVDGGHNVDAARSVAEMVRSWQAERPGVTIDLVFGALNNRPAGEYFHAFDGLVRMVRTVAIPGEANSLSAGDAGDAARDVGLSAEPADSVAAAVDSLTQTANEPHIILICGSLYLAGTVLADHD